MADERLKYFIEALWMGRGEVDSARRDIDRLGETGKKGAEGVKKVTTAGDLLRGTFATLAASAVVGKVTQEILQFGRDSLATAGDVAEMQSKFDTVFGAGAGGVTRQLDEFAESANRSTSELMGFAATLQDTFVPLGFARDEAAEMSVAAVKLAEDLASFNNLPTAQVVQDIQSALVGNTETLRKYGVVASQAAIEQEAYNSGIWNGEDALDAQMKAMAIYQLTLKGTTDAQGDAIRTADSYVNRQKGLESAIVDLQTAVGNRLIPAMSEATRVTTEFVQAITENLNEAALLDEGLARGAISAEEYAAAQRAAALQAQGAKGATEAYATVVDKAAQGVEAMNMRLEYNALMLDATARASAVYRNEVSQAEARAALLRGEVEVTTEVLDALALVTDENTAKMDDYRRILELTAPPIFDVGAAAESMRLANLGAVESTNSLTEAALASAIAHGANAEQMTAVYVQLGLLTAEEAENITKTAEATAAAQALGLALAEGSISASEMHLELKSLNQELLGIVDRQVTIKFRTDLSEWTLPPGVAADDAAVKGGVGVGFASGTGGWREVPPGYPNDTYGPVWLSSGERFNVVPAGGSGSSVSTTFDMRGATFGAGTSADGIMTMFETAMRRAGLTAQARMRV